MFPLAGFFSKDEIIDNVGHNGYTVFMWIALGGAFLTAAYTVRATYLTFFGEPRGAAAGVSTTSSRARRELALVAHDAPHDVQQEPTSRTSAGHYAGSTPVVGAGRRARRTTTSTPAPTTGPHESPKLILIPICILAALADASPASPTPRPFGEDGRSSRSTSSRARGRRAGGCR